MNKITVNLVLGFSIASIGTALRAADQPAATNAAAPVEAGATNSAAPKIVFATPVYDFGKVKSGDPVKYTYVFTNTGDATLTLSDVHPSCGCTTAGDWTRQVEPGKTGAIPVQFNSAAYGGATTRASRQ